MSYRRCCTVLYREHSMCVILPLSGHEEQSDSYTFVKDCLSDFPEVAATDIQVYAVGANLPGPWPRRYALQPGTYRVTLHPGAARSVAAGIATSRSPWQTKIVLSGLQPPQYFPKNFCLPQELQLTLIGDNRLPPDDLQRKPVYQCDSKVMEWPFAEHFSTEDPSIRFKISPPVQPHSESQSAFVKCLSELKLMLRVRHFSLQTELLLLPCKNEVLAFVRPAGHIETLAKQEFNFYADGKQLVAVCDLDLTLVEAQQCGLDMLPHCSQGRTFSFTLCHHGTSITYLCTPRASMLQMMQALQRRFFMFFLTAGTYEYGVEVVKGIRNHLLTDPQLVDNTLRTWIEDNVKIERVMSSAFCRQQGPDGREHSFKTSGMLLKLAYVPEYAAKLLVILDDDEQAHSFDLWLMSCGMLPFLNGRGTIPFAHGAGAR
ncbi:hypothetical protein ABBQ38_008850 [Trebouxia sp. C0009 RCD-2024]